MRQFKKQHQDITIPDTVMLRHEHDIVDCCIREANNDNLLIKREGPKNLYFVTNSHGFETALINFHKTGKDAQYIQDEQEAYDRFIYFCRIGSHEDDRKMLIEHCMQNIVIHHEEMLELVESRCDSH